jgi:hypothetical protein
LDIDPDEQASVEVKTERESPQAVYEAAQQPQRRLPRVALLSQCRTNVAKACPGDLAHKRSKRCHGCNEEGNVSLPDDNKLPKTEVEHGSTESAMWHQTLPAGLPNEKDPTDKIRHEVLVNLSEKEKLTENGRGRALGQLIVRQAENDARHQCPQHL